MGSRRGIAAPSMQVAFSVVEQPLSITERRVACVEKEASMYHSHGNYEAFARPRKPMGVDEKSAYLVGAGLASLSAAAFLVRDGQMDGKRITILEAATLPGGAMDGIERPTKGFLVRGDRELEDHMECLWDLFRSIPSLEVENASVLDKFYWLNKDNPNYSLCRTTQNRGEPNPTDGKMTLSRRAQGEILQLCITRDEDLYDRKITDVLGQDFLDSNFWLYWRTMFAFEEWHSALEMKLYLNRFVHLVGGMANSERHQAKQVQPVRVLHPPTSHLAEAARRHHPVRHTGDQRALRHHGPAQGRPAHRLDPRRTARRG